MRFRRPILSAAAFGWLGVCAASAQTGASDQVPFTPVNPTPAAAPASAPVPIPSAGGGGFAPSPTTTPVQPPAPNFSAPPLPAASPPPLQAAPASAAAPPLLSVKQALPETIIPGQPVTAEVSVTNTGGKPADNVVLSGWWTNGYTLGESSVVAQMVNGRQSWGLGAIAAGETRSLKLKLAPQQGVMVTEFRSGFDATFSSASDTRAVKVIKPEVQLQLVAPEVVFVGQPVAVQLKVKNPTAMPITNVSIRSSLPDTVAHPKGNNLESELAVIPAGATEVIPLDLTAVRSGEGRARVRIAAAGCEAVEQEVRLTAMEARVSVSLNGPKALYQNWPATYEAVIENQGDQPIKAATLEVKLPTGFTDLRASDKPGYDSASHRIVWKLDDLKPGEKKTVVWFGFGKQADDLITVGAVTVSGATLKRAEWVTKNLGAEAK